MSNWDRVCESTLRSKLPAELAEDLVKQFLAMQQDLSTHTFERAAPGKFVETFVQALQFLGQGTYEENPDVDEYLRKVQDGPPRLDDGLRICGARIARAMYAIRSKRSIVHKGNIDPNRYDLAMLYASAQWIMAELVRNASGISMEEAGSLVAQIQAPVPAMVEDFGNFKLVLHKLSAEHEILVLLQDDYPNAVLKSQLADCVGGRPDSTIRAALSKLRGERLVIGNSKSGYKLTRTGLALADKIVAQTLLTRKAAE